MDQEDVAFVVGACVVSLTLAVVLHYIFSKFDSTRKYFSSSESNVPPQTSEILDEYQNPVTNALGDIIADFELLPQNERKNLLDNIRDQQQIHQNESSQAHSIEQRQKEIEEMQKKEKKLGFHIYGKGEILSKEEEKSQEETRFLQQRLVDQKSDIIKEETRKKKEQEAELKQMMKMQRELERRSAAKKLETEKSQARFRQQEKLEQSALEHLEMQREKKEKEDIKRKIEMKKEHLKLQQEKEYNKLNPTTSQVELDRHLRELQDLEYQQSLQDDEEKELFKVMEESAKENDQNQKKMKIQNRLAKIANLPQQPAEGDKQSTTIIVRLPSNNRLTRRFEFNTPLRVLLDFIEGSLLDHDFIDNYAIVMNFPKKIVSKMDPNQTLMEAFGLQPSTTLFVEELASESQTS